MVNPLDDDIDSKKKQLKSMEDHIKLLNEKQSEIQSQQKSMLLKYELSLKSKLELKSEYRRYKNKVLNAINVPVVVDTAENKELRLFISQLETKLQELVAIEHRSSQAQRSKRKESVANNRKLI
eukprot:NODE_15_length_42055_cov_0.634117.p20 type:complete len:124 gc:universal NODE_15_length_42055_cov_0.634117:15825-15454(-)